MPKHQKQTIRQIRWERNKKDCFSLTSTYTGDRFGQNHAASISYPNDAKLPSDIFKKSLAHSLTYTLLDPYYKPDELKALYALSCRRTINKKSLKNQTLFTPRIALYLIFMSEDDILKEYIHAWKKYQPHISLKIPEELIKKEYRYSCGCTGCFGQCIILADKYELLPKKTINDDITSMREILDLMGDNK